MEQPVKRKFEYLRPESYLVMIKNSVGTKMFRTFYVKDEKGRTTDILKNGDLSCPVFVCHILLAFGLIQKSHFTVARTVDDLVESGFKKVTVKAMKPGDVIVWAAHKGRTGYHTHIGFFVGKDRAISNSSKKREVAKHHYTYGGKREISAVYRPNWAQFKKA
jgi:hypothetical protein